MPVGYSVYREVASPIHRLDPRVKLSWLLALFALALCFNHPAVLGALNLGVLGVAVAARLRFRDFRPYLLMALWLTALSVVIWPAYIAEGTLLGRVWFIEFTDTGLLFGLAMGLRIALMILAASTWMMTTSPQTVTAGLLAVGLPYKAGLAMSSAIRFIPLMNAERVTILEAQRARGLDLASGGPIKRSLRAAPVLVPLFSRAFLTAQHLSVAMDGRGFGARPGRTSITTLHLTGLDRRLLIAAPVAVAAGLVCRVLGAGVLVENLL
ncbi:MAG: energy-coupling factor transporter transmembrane protein EcfT [Euzebyales bacterium]|nr:energy-coupling factor transporter transmembrane protein EcfT [Euzebyales bacterium]MBA3621725.1 energy-coupling factor transporter transmembrane protein EcfT [Euzebyales bacterium]